MTHLLVLGCGAAFFPTRRVRYPLAPYRRFFNGSFSSYLLPCLIPFTLHLGISSVQARSFPSIFLHPPLLSTALVRSRHLSLSSFPPPRRYIPARACWKGEGSASGAESIVSRGELDVTIYDDRGEEHIYHEYFTTRGDGLFL